MDRHATLVRSVSARIASFHASKTPFRIYHGSTNSTRPMDFEQDHIVDTSELNQVLEFDVDRKTVVVEPNVPMDALVRATIGRNLLPPVVMEFPGITVGGGFVGTAGESSSFKHGFFDCTINWAEVVLADGTVVRASNDERADLFRGLPGSFGTLGVLTLVEIQLVDLKRFVELRYDVVESRGDAVSRMRSATQDEQNDYVDGILFSKSKGVVVTGRLVDSPLKNGHIQRFSRAWDPWFYMHAQHVMKTARSSPYTEYVPIEDYLFRYDRGAFWMGFYAFKIFGVPFNRITRFVVDRYVHTRIMYHALHASKYSDRIIIQDLALPVSTVGQFLDYVDEKFEIYPLWLCPLRKDIRRSAGYPKDRAILGSTPNSQNMEDEEYISVGLWGPGPGDEEAFISANRELEAKLQELDGLKWLYAKAFYTEEEFWDVYDQEKYEAVRRAYHAESLPSIYDKVKEKKKAGPEPGLRGAIKRLVFRSFWLRGIYGTYKAIWGGDYLLKRQARRPAGKEKAA